MNCPICKTKPLVAGELEAGLPALHCDECGGSWLGADAYEHWRHKGAPAEGGNIDVQLVSGERGGLKFCPKCKYILIKYKVGHDVGFSIDRCGQCAGIWFDKNEWEILRSKKLTGHVHEVFSQAWQSAVREHEHEQAMQEILKDRLGEKDYEELERIRKWMDNHPHSEELYSLLFGSRAKSKALTS